jgi:regulator of sirC expression with transglutaminase-like and TPR domain
MTPTPSSASTRARLETLLGLLDDPSPAVRSALLREFQAMGEPAVLFLRQLANGTGRTQSLHALDFLRELNVTDTVAEFRSYIRGGKHELETGVLLLARTVHEDLDVVAVGAQLDQLASRCRELMPESCGTRDKCRVINRVLFHEQGLVGDMESYTDPRNSFLHTVLERRRGIPITLSILYLLVAERLGLQLEPIALPGHFVVGCFGEERPFFVDPFYQGAFRGTEEIFQMLRQNHVVPRAADLAPATIRDVLLRCCRNLVNHDSAAGDASRAAVFATFAEEFEATARRTPSTL